MLTLLAPHQYPNVYPLFAGLDYNLVIRSVIAGNTPGCIYADDPDQPTTVLIWDKQDSLLVAGSTEQGDDLRTLLLEKIMPDARARWIPGLVILWTPEI